MKFILGKKIQMTQVFKENGEVIPVTIVVAGPCVVTQVKEKNPAGRRSIQIGLTESTEKRIGKQRVGHLKGLPILRDLREFEESESELQRGDKFTVENFKVGERVDVTGISKGKGYQGVVKRHHFAGGPATHGHKDNLRAPGAIGAGGVQRVFKGLRMAGHMGDVQVTVKNLEIAEVDTQNNILKIKGAIPGSRNSLVIIKTIGVLKAEAKEAEVAPAPETVVETKVEETTIS